MLWRSPRYPLREQGLLYTITRLSTFRSSSPYYPLTFAHRLINTSPTMPVTAQPADDFLSFVNASPTRMASIIARCEASWLIVYSFPCCSMRQRKTGEGRICGDKSSFPFGRSMIVQYEAYADNAWGRNAKHGRQSVSQAGNTT